VIELLPRKCKALSSNPSDAKKKKKKTKKKIHVNKIERRCLIPVFIHALSMPSRGKSS
jgi:hypothetical protein